jgi:hypothetical protein
MQDRGLVLQVHGEVTAGDVDVFDREHVFIERVLAPLSEQFPRLRIVFEHVTTHAAVEFVRAARPGIAATITPQHLLLNRNAIFAGGIRPHHYCLPVLKREQDRRALLDAATSDARFFLGTDSAPHSQSAKEAACGCAGVFSAHAGIELYAEAFEQAGRLALREAVSKAGNMLLEPIMKVVITTPEDYLGSITGDVSSRRGMIVETEDRGILKLVHCEVPLSEMFGYTTVLRGLSQGRASSTMEFLAYRALPSKLQQEVLATG